MNYTWVFMLLASPAWADCGGYERTFLTCQVENSSKILSVCFDDEFASYRFGPQMGPPELEIIEPIATLKFRPWPGEGSVIWEEVQFFNEDHSYMITAATKRIFPDESEAVVGEERFGGVLVHRISKTVADLRCDPDRIVIKNVGGSSLAKNRLGYVWNNAGQEWVELLD